MKPNSNLPDNVFLEEATLSKVAKNAGGGAGGKILFYLLNYFIVIIITRSLGAADYGIIILTYSIIVIIAMAASLGLNEGIVRYISFFLGKDDAGRAKGVLISSLKLVSFSSVILAVILFFSAEFLAQRVFSKPEIALPLKIFSLAILPLALGRIFTAGLQAIQLVKFRILVENAVRPLVLLVILALLLVTGISGVNYVIGSYIGSIVVGCALAAVLLIRTYPALMSSGISPIYEYNQLLKFSLPLFGVGVLTFVVERIDIFMLGYFMPSEQVGVYGATARTANIVLLPFTAFALIFLPLVAAYHGKEEMGKILLLFKLVTKWIVTMSLPLFIILSLFSGEIMLVFGPSFPMGRICLILLCCGWMCQNLGGPANGLIMMTGHSRLNLINYLIICVSDIILNILLIPRYGIEGAALATAISMALISLIRGG